MAIFQPITLTWAGRDFVVPADRVMGAIGVIEDVVTFPELVGSLQSSKPNMSKLARAYGAVLRYAGASVSDEEIYRRHVHARPATAADRGCDQCVDGDDDAARCSQAERVRGKPAGRPGKIVEALYKAAVGGGWVSRSEFWAMCPCELWWLIEAKTPPKMVGSLTEDEASELYDMVYEG